MFLMGLSDFNVFDFGSKRLSVVLGARLLLSGILCISWLLFKHKKGSYRALYKLRPEKGSLSIRASAVSMLLAAIHIRSVDNPQINFVEQILAKIVKRKNETRFGDFGESCSWSATALPNLTSARTAESK